MLRGALLIGLVGMLAFISLAPTAQADGWDGCVQPVAEAAYELLKHQDPTKDPTQFGDCQATRPSPEECLCAIPPTCAVYRLLNGL